MDSRAALGRNNNRLELGLLITRRDTNKLTCLNVKNLNPPYCHGVVRVSGVEARVQWEPCVRWEPILLGSGAGAMHQ